MKMGNNGIDESFFWYKNGQVESEIKYINGKGKLMTWWYENGKKKQEAVCDEYGREVKSTEWYENGQKKFEREYYYIPIPSDYKFPERDWLSKDGGRTSFERPYKTGKWIEWYPNGQQSSETQYIKGTKIDKEIKWYENGQKKSEVEYVDGNETYSWKWDETGKIISEGAYENGVFKEKVK